MVDLPDAASVVFVNLSSLLRSSSTKERGDQEQDQGDREDGQGLLSAQVKQVPLRSNTCDASVAILQRLFNDCMQGGVGAGTAVEGFDSNRSTSPWCPLWWEDKPHGSPSWIQSQSQDHKLRRG